MKRIVAFIAMATFLLAFLLSQLQLTGWLKDDFLHLSSHWYEILITIYVVTIAVIIVILILEKNRPTKTLAWLLVIVFLPVGGLILYLFFGINYRKEKIFNRKGLTELERIEAVSRQQLEVLKKSPEELPGYSSYVRKSLRLLLASNQSLYTEQNRVEILLGGQAKLSALRADIEQARHHIHLEYYIIEDSTFGNALRDMVIEKAREGVKVRVIIDGVGSWELSRPYRQSLLDAGVELVEFMPVRFPYLTSSFNYRNHRKIIVIDGKVGYTGGLNFSDRYLLGDHFGMWRDTHLRLEGDAVKMLQLIFQFDWYFSSGEKLSTDTHYFPEVDLTDRNLIQIVSSGPDSDYASIMQAYFHAVSAARHYVFIATPYFIPNESIMTALQTAAMSGIDVRLLIPNRVDSRLVHYCSNSFLGQLLDAGVKIYRYQGGFLHCKIMIADNCFASVGSANMDIRSFETNFEVNAMVYEREVVRKLKQQYLDDLKQSRRLHPREFHNRPNWQKGLEGLARLVAPVL